MTRRTRSASYLRPLNGIDHDLGLQRWRIHDQLLLPTTIDPLADIRNGSVFKTASVLYQRICATNWYGYYGYTLLVVLCSPSILIPYAATGLALIFVPQANEMFYDLGGAAGFLSTTFISLYYPSLKAKFWDRNAAAVVPTLRDFPSRQLIISAMLGMWSVRLGSFLVQRAIRAGGDSRFDEVKHQPAKFTAFWMAQATWIFLVGLPVYLCNSIPARAHPPLGIRDYASLAFFASSFLFEVIADRQKSEWRRAKGNKEHDEKFISKGLWNISRHPNYVGEVGIWTGVWAFSTSALQTPYFPPGMWVVAGVSPLVTYALLRYVSGVPPLERSAKKKWGNDPAYLSYEKKTPVFWPWTPTYT